MTSSRGEGERNPRQAQVDALIALGAGAFATVGLPAIAYVISRLTAIGFTEVARRLVIGGTALLVVVTFALAYFAARSKVLRGPQVRDLIVMTAPLIGALILVRFVSGWHGEIAGGALILSVCDWTFHVLVFLRRAPEPDRPTALESSLGGGLTRFGESLFHIGRPLVRLGNSFSGGAAVMLCTFVVSLLFLSLILLQASGLALSAIYAPTKSANHAGLKNKPPKKTHKQRTKRKSRRSRKKSLPPFTPPTAVTPAPPLPDSTSLSWTDVCGTAATSPGYELPPLEAAEFQKLFYGPGQPGAPGTGCTGRTKVVPGHRDIRYLVGVNSAGATQSIAIVWRTGRDSYDGALVIAPATAAFWQLVLEYGRIHADWRIDVGNGDAVVIWSRAGTTLLIRSTKTVDGRAAPYVQLDPPAADLWLNAVEQHHEWLWPIVDTSSARTRSYVLMHDPVLKEVVARISYDAQETQGNQISLAQIERYAPPPP